MKRSRLLFKGKDIRQLPVVSLRSQVVLVNQESRLLGMNVRTALGYPLRLQNRPDAEIAEAVEQWAERLKIPADWMDRTTVNLSLGQRQRVAIARALIMEPTLLLLDEPTSAQDIGYSEFLLTRLAELTAQRQLTVIMANHQIELLSRHATHLWKMENGRLVTDISATDVDWAALRQTLVTAEAEHEAEWA
ncbi:MAG: ATP-binding cassette domain-containing protein [Cyanobacteria bacterium J06649_4]